MQTIKPSNLIDFTAIPNGSNFMEIKRPTWYGWYWDGAAKKFLPHRKPTINEIVENRFNT